MPSKYSRRKGADFESLIQRGLRDALGDDRILRAPRWGSKDKGDVTGVRLKRTKPVAVVVVTPSDERPLAIECKNVARISLPLATEEAKIEAANAGAVCGVVVHKRYGSRDPMKQWVSMTVEDFVALATGGSPSTQAK